MTELVLTTIADKVATITLNRPDKLNAFTIEMVDRWADALEAAIARPDVAVIVMTGAGRAFCAGGDIEILMQARGGGEPLERKAELAEHVHRIPRALSSNDKPVIAALNGAAIGAGLDLALMADLRYAAESAKFAETYVRMGIVPGAGGAYFLPRRVGLAKALELFLTGDTIDAREAERIGLVNKVLPDAELMPYVRALAQRLAAGPSQAIRMTKRALYQSQTMDLAGSLDLVTSHYGLLTQSADHREAVAAFLEKRKPGFGGA
jgi:2-(1,2-epoxy-1,2-dihydrophenyl)acetyl-CoA isomerase